MGTLALTGATVLTSLSPPAITKDEVVIDGGRIRSIGAAEGADARRIDCSGCLVIPGNVCAHHHLYSALARGMPFALEPPENFTQILQRVWWRLDRALDARAIWMSAWAGGADALLAGTTTILDHHASPNEIHGSLDQVRDPLEQLGSRSILCYEVTDRDGPERAWEAIEENRRFLMNGRSSVNEPCLTQGVVGAHASFTLSEETLGACVKLAQESGTGIHIHVAEDAADQRDCLARLGKRVVHRLAEAGVLDGRSLLAHCVHLDRSELEILRPTGAMAVHNPRSNMNNGVGHAPVLGFDNLALGTDGIGGDMFAESRAAFWRARESDLSIAPQWALDRLADSARFAGAVFGEGLLGRLEPGAPADVVVLEYDPPTPVTAENAAGHWVFGLTAQAVRDVIVAGQEVVRDRRLVRTDQDGLKARSRELAGQLWDRMESIGEHPFQPAG